MIDLDHNATTPPHPEVIATVARVAREAPGNPGSRHAGGRAARRVLEQSREIVADVLGASPTEVVFTSGGTESNNIAIFGFARGREGASAGVFAALEGEHPSIEEPLEDLAARGWTRRVIPMDAAGLPSLDVADIPTLLQGDVAFVTMLLAHNETGVVRDLRPWAEACAGLRIPLHIDAVQAAGKIGVSFRDSGATTMSIAAHKFRGPRGVGALIIRNGARLPPRAFGGHQENGVRPGTECTALAAGMARALELWRNDREALNAQLTRLRDRLESGILAAVPGTFVHAASAPRLPNTTNIAFPGCDGEALLVALDLAGVGASLGSACASGSSEPAPILLAMGCPPEIARASLRFSVGWTNTDQEIEDAIMRIARVVQTAGGCRRP